MKLAEMYVEIGANDNKLTSAFRRIEGQCKQVGASLTAFAAVATAAFAGNALVRSMQGVVDEAIDMESRMAQLRKTTGLSGDALDKLQREITRLGSTMAGVKLNELFDIAVMGGRLGVAGDKIAGFVRDIGMIRVALDDIPAEEAATKISRTLNVFGKGTEDAIRFASALNKLDDTSTATGRDILDISQRLSGSAAVLGLSPQKVLALSAALKDAGVENEVAGTAVSQIFMKMATDTKDFAKVAGVSTKAFAGMIRRDPLEALMALESGLKRFDQFGKFAALDKLGLDGARTAQTLLQLGAVTDKLGGYVKVANSEWRSLSSIMAENQAQSETTAAQLDRMRNVFQVTSARLGSFFLPVVKAVSGSLASLAEDFRGFLDASKAGIEAFAAKMTTAGKWLAVAFSEWRTLFSMGATVVQEKMEQIGAIVARTGSKIWDQLKWGAVTAYTVIKNVFSDFGSFLADLFSQIGANLTAQITNAMAKIKLPKILGGGNLAMAVSVPKIVPNPGLIGNPIRGVNARPGFDAGGIFKDLPNQAGRLAVLMARLNGILEKNAALKAQEAFKDRVDIQAGIAKLPGAVKGLVNPRPLNAREQVAAQNKENGMPAFKGTEEQARRILETRAKRKAERDDADRRRAAGKGQGLAGAGGGAAARLAEKFGAGEGMQQLARGLVGAALGGLPGAINAMAGAPGANGKGGIPRAGQGAEGRGGGKVFGLEEFKNAIQEGIFGKKEQYAEATANGVKDLVEIGNKLVNRKPKGANPLGIVGA